MKRSFDDMRTYSFIKRWQFYQHSRSHAGMQRWRGIFIIPLLLLLLLRPESVGAQADYPGGFTLRPLVSHDIALLSMTADVNFHDDGTSTTAEVQVNYRLHNRNQSKNQVLSVAIPGYAVTQPPPETIALFLGGKEVALERGHEQWWVADVTLKPNQRVNLVMSYSVILGNDPIVHFRYPLDLTAQMWSGVLESARFTIAFAEPPNPQSWLGLMPETYKLSAEAVTWSYDVEDPQEAIDFRFIRPSLWQQIIEARRTAAAQDSAEAHQTLGSLYAQLAATSTNPEIFQHFFPLAVASYSRAQQLAPQKSESYLALSELYQLRASLSPQEAAEYKALAINELIKALENDVNDTAIQQDVITGITALIARARSRGDFDATNAYLQRVEELSAKHPDIANSPDIQAERRALAIDWARHVLEDQGPAPARQVLAQLFGPDVVESPDVSFARANSLYIVVRTEPHQRTISINAAMREGNIALVEALANKLANTKIAKIELLELDPVLLNIEISFKDAAELQNKQFALAEAIPQQPEWELIRALLRSRTLTWTRTEERWRSLEDYEESVSLVAVSADAATQGMALMQGAQAMDSSDSLNRLLADIWMQEASVWQNLADNSSVRYFLTLYPRPGAPLEQSWTVLPGKELTMSGRATQYHLATMALLALGLYALFVLLTWMLFQMFRR